MVQRILCRYSRKKQKAIEQYIRNQLQEDVSAEQLSLKEYIDPFTGKPVEEGK